MSDAEKKTPAKKASKPKAAPTHPKTSVMVVAAIKALKERNGSSLPAIKKYIAANYKVDTVKLAPFIKKALKSMVEKKVLIQTKGKGASGSFKVGAAEKKPAAAKKPAAKKAAKKPAGEKKAKTPKKKAAAKPKKAAGEKKAKTPKKAKAAAKPKKSPAKKAAKPKAAKPAAKKAKSPAKKAAKKPAKKAAAKK